MTTPATAKTAKPVTTKAATPAPTRYTPTISGPSKHTNPSSHSSDSSNTRPKSNSQHHAAVHADTSKPQRSADAKAGTNAANSCPPATLQLYKLAGRPGLGASSTCTSGAVKNNAANDNVQNATTGSSASPVFIAPGVVSFTPVTVPKSSVWGGSALSTPFTPTQLQRYAQLVGKLTEPPPYLVRIYKAAARRYGLPWPVLAAINYVETGYGADPNYSSAGAEGWMQFMPGTWRAYGEAVDIRGRIMAHVAANPWNARDAIFSAARYLVAHGAHSDLPRAIFAYNHAVWYVQEVLSVAQQIDEQGMKPGAQAGKLVDAMGTMARLLNGMPYVWGGGHGSWEMTTGYDCSGFVSQVLHAGGYLSQPVTTQSLPLQNGIVTGPGRWISIFDRTDSGGLASDHVIIDINGQWWESGGSSADGGAGDVHRISHMNATYLTSFNLVLHPRGL
jgi:hypothetical protein